MTSDSMMSPPAMNDGSDDDPVVMKRSTWPTVFGIIGIVLGALGMLSATCSFFLPVIFQSILEQLPPEEQAQLMSSMPAGPFLYVGVAVGLVLSILLLWGSVRLLKRRSSARGTLNMYAVASILWFIASFIWQATVLHPEMKARQAEQMQAAQAQSDQQASQDETAAPGQQDFTPTTPAQDEMMADTQFYFSQACSGVMTIGWCVLVLVFMNAPRYRDEMETWVD